MPFFKKGEVNVEITRILCKFWLRTQGQLPQQGRTISKLMKLVEFTLIY